MPFGIDIKRRSKSLGEKPTESQNIFKKFSDDALRSEDAGSDYNEDINLFVPSAPHTYDDSKECRGRNNEERDNDEDKLYKIINKIVGQNISEINKKLQSQELRIQQSTPGFGRELGPSTAQIAPPKNLSKSLIIFCVCVMTKGLIFA